MINVYIYICHHIACRVFGLVAYSGPIKSRRIEREVLESIVKKLKHEKASGADNELSELYKYGPDKFKTTLMYTFY